MGPGSSPLLSGSAHWPFPGQSLVLGLCPHSHPQLQPFPCTTKVHAENSAAFLECQLRPLCIVQENKTDTKPLYRVSAARALANSGKPETSAFLLKIGAFVLQDKAGPAGALFICAGVLATISNS